MQYIYAPRNYYQRVRHILKELKNPAATTPADWQRIPRILARLPAAGRILGKESVSNTGGCWRGPWRAGPFAFLGGNPVHLRLSLPQDMRVAYSLNKGSKILAANGIHLEQTKHR
jgi:hypothetical protein